MSSVKRSQSKLGPCLSTDCIDFKSIQHIPGWRKGRGGGGVKSLYTHVVA